MAYKSGCLLLLLASSAAVAFGSYMPAEHETSCTECPEQYEEVKPKIDTMAELNYIHDPEPLPTKTAACKTAYARVSTDKRTKIFNKLVTLFGAQALLSSESQVVTVIAPTDTAILTTIGRFGYSLDDFLAMPPQMIAEILNNHIIPNFEITTEDTVNGTVIVPSISTASNLISLQAYTGVFEKLCFAPTNNYTNVCARCGNKDLDSCSAVVHIVDELILTKALPPLAPLPGCSTVYSYISARHDMQDLKAAIDVAGLTGFFDSTRTPGTFFLPTDYATATLIQLNDFPRRRLADMDVDFITTFLLNHVIPNATIYSYQFKSGQTYETANADYWLLADINAAKANLFMIWNEVTNVTVVEADIPKCSAVVHVINTPLTPVGYNPITVTDVCSTYGPFKSVADLLAACPALSGMYDLVGASALAHVAASCTTFGTWFIPSNQALCRMAARGLSTELLFADKQRLLNFVNSQVLPYSSLPFASLANGVVLKTAYTPAEITIQKTRVISGETFNNAPGNVEVRLFSVVDKTDIVSQVNFSSYDLQCGQAIANVIEDALLSPAILPAMRRLAKKL